MRFRALILLAALVVAVSPGIAWGGPTVATFAGHNKVLAAGMRPDGNGTVGGQARAVRSNGDGTVVGQGRAVQSDGDGTVVGQP